MRSLLTFFICMDIFSVLTREHAEVKGMLTQLEETTTRAVKTRQGLFVRLREALLLHAKAEERSFYECLKQQKDFRELMLEAEEEHKVAERLLEELVATPVEDERWKAKMTVLKESTEHHVEEEEKELFPKAKRLLSREEREKLAEQFDVEKNNAQREL